MQKKRKKKKEKKKEIRLIIRASLFINPALTDRHGNLNKT